MSGHGDWLVAALSLASAWLMSSHRRGAWPVAIVTNVAGAIYFARHGQDGLVALEAAFVAINTRGWLRWRPTDAPTPSTPEGRLAALLDHHAPRRSAVVRAQRAAQARHARRNAPIPANTTGGNP